MSKVPEGQLRRASIVGGTAIRLGARNAQRRLRAQIRPGAESTAASAQFDEETAQLLFNTLGQLKGTPLKLAQMLSMEVDILPEKFQQELARSCYQVPPLNRVLVNKVLTQSFDQPVNSLFESFESTAFAAASFGQVHKATLDGDDQVAVKIQYPGIQVAMESDMKLLRKIVKALPNRKLVDQSIAEIHERLHEELDYQLEARNTEWFHQHLRMDGIEVPRVYFQRCSQKVLTTQRLDGLHLDQWLANNPSQESRNLAGQRLYDLFVKSVLQLKCLHADPNPGNFLFRDDGSIGLIDFGCVRTFSDQFTSALPPLLNALSNGDKDAVFRLYASVGMLFNDADDAMFDHVLKPFGQWLGQPFERDSFDFCEHQDYTSSGRELIHRLAKLSCVDSIAQEFIFFDRTIYGLCKILEKMKACVRMRHHWV